MRFVDEAIIDVVAGKGGDGCLSFRREKFIPFGGPDGGDGGDGGSIFLIGDSGLNTLADFRYSHRFKADDGERGMGAQCTGRCGQDLFVRVPLGTLVLDHESDEVIGDVIAHDQTLLVAKGGFHGFGNLHFKSSTNRAPRHTTTGRPGDARRLRLELQVLADVGLLGLPNAGKSTFIRAVSAARPKVADYPFTTLHPNLGVVRMDVDNSFVIADIPGLIEGAADGAGLGIQFLKHLSRTRLLLHLVDILPPSEDPAHDAETIWQELQNYSSDLAERERWLVFNKLDLLLEEEQQAHCQAILDKLNWQGRVFHISAISGTGCQALCREVMNYLNELKAQEPPETPVATPSPASVWIKQDAEEDLEE